MRSLFEKTKPSQTFMTRNVSLFRLQGVVCHPKHVRKVSGLSRNGPLARFAEISATKVFIWKISARLNGMKLPVQPSNKLSHEATQLRANPFVCTTILRYLSIKISGLLVSFAICLAKCSALRTHNFPFQWHFPSQSTIFSK